MAEPELLLDSNIRLWVVLPIVFITFLVGVIRHYVSILLQSDKKLTLEQVSDRYVGVTCRCNRRCNESEGVSDHMRSSLTIQPSPYPEQNPERKWEIHPETGTLVLSGYLTTFYPRPVHFIHIAQFKRSKKSPKFSILEDIIKDIILKNKYLKSI